MQHLRRRISRSLFALAVVACTSPAGAADVQTIVGTWQLASPQTTLTPEDGRAVPLTALGKRFYSENQKYRAKKQYDEYDRTLSRCAAPGMPRMMLMPGRIQIYVRPELVFMSFEWNRLIRSIMLPGFPKQLPSIGGDAQDLVGTNAGSARGHWEGDTLVIETSKFSDKALIDELVPHGYDLKLTERLRLTDPMTLEHRISIEDPEYFTRPWSAVLKFTRQPDAVFPEDVCLDRLKGPPPLAGK